MPTLLEQARRAQAGIEKVARANQLRYQLAVIQERSAEWAARKGQHAQLRRRAGYLPLNESASAQMANADEPVRALCAEARQRLQANGNVQALAEDELWVQLLAKAESANKVCEEAIRAAWRQLIQELGEVEPANTVASRIPATPANERVLARYRELYARYTTLRSTVTPTDEASADQLRVCVEQLREIHATLTPAPVAVQKFFKAIEAGGATLDFMTEEVLTWLKSHDDWGRFVVRLRAGNAWR